MQSALFQQSHPALGRSQNPFLVGLEKSVEMEVVTDLTSLPVMRWRSCQNPGILCERTDRVEGRCGTSGTKGHRERVQQCVLTESPQQQKQITQEQIDKTQTGLPSWLSM